MADSDIILRPKIDRGALKKANDQMAKAHVKYMKKAAKTAATYTGKAMTAALKQAAKAGGSATHSAFQVGLGGVMEMVQGMINDIDGTVDRIQQRSMDLSNLRKNAKAFGMKSSEMFALEGAAELSGMDIGAIYGLLEGFNDELADAERFGDGYRQLAKEQGNFAAMMKFIKEEVTGKDEATQRQALLHMGATGSAGRELMLLLQEMNGRSIDELNKAYYGMSSAEVERKFEQGETTARAMRAEMNKERANSLNQNAASSKNISPIQQLNERQRDFMNAQEKTLGTVVELRSTVYEMQNKVRDMLVMLIEHTQKVINAYDEGGITAALGTAVSPITKAISEMAGDMKKNIKEGISEALREVVPDFMLKARVEQDARGGSSSPKANGFVMQEDY